MGPGVGTEPDANTGAFQSVCRGPPAGGIEHEAPRRLGVGLCPDIWDSAAQGDISNSLHADAPSLSDSLPWPLLSPSACSVLTEGHGHHITSALGGAT